MIWLYILKEYIMNNKPIVITTNACVNGIEVFKMVVELPHGFAGLDGKYREQTSNPPECSNESHELASYKALEKEGYRKAAPVNGRTMWTRFASRPIFTDQVGAWVADGLPTPHPISAEWVCKYDR
jgi:hypothetical protein